ncbi:AraC family transcriptional regulator [Pedobacter africanus]|uniref:Transcriptional regulator, AraC family n=1 Tax=Pedobacter africanus TaxID=151894 RepID=A0A1W1YWT2_9SPHI|nr:helix-turn-helix domain-containing protein [Pedobacter africanus]SMC40675.1 transcriptional regulator, AraC family [Pedobacter africanus]
MRIQTYDIIPVLQAYVKLICTMDCDDDTETSHIRVLPDTCAELFLNYTNTPVAHIGGELHQRSIVTFRMNQFMDVQMRKGAGVVAVCFHPGMAYRFIQIPMHELSNTTTALADVWHDMATALEEKMACAGCNEDRVGLIQQYLFGQLAYAKDDLHMTQCLSAAQSSGGLVPARQLAFDTGLSQRQLSRKFQEQVGLSPKEYLRVYRFIRSLDHLKRHPVLSLTEIACKSGYYDQAHFIRDYKDYTGYTPRQVALNQDILF